MVLIGIVPDPLAHPDWPQMKAFLEPAARLGHHAGLIERNEAVWAVYDGGLKAAATARLTVNNEGEIILCGGIDAKAWARPLADRICDWFTLEGMAVARIYGRKGWLRLLDDWRVVGGANGFTWLERALA